MDQITTTDRAGEIAAALGRQAYADAHGPAAVKRNARGYATDLPKWRRRVSMGGVPTSPDGKINIVRLLTYARGQLSLLRAGHYAGRVDLLFLARSLYVAERYARLKARAEARADLVGERYSRFGFAWARANECEFGGLTVDHRPRFAGDDMPFVITLGRRRAA